MSETSIKNPDEVTAEDIIQEIQRLNPTILQLAAANIRAAQWRRVALEKSEPQE